MDVEKKLRIMLIILITISIGFISYIIVFFRNTHLIILSGVFIGLIIILFIILYKTTNNYISNLLEQLSDLISTITDMEEREIFALNEDNMLSKLQSQVIKLTSILKARNRASEHERNEIKSLISDISHQLKTPISNIKMYEEFLHDEGLTHEERKEFQEIIRISLLKLEFLVESIIKISRLEGGIISLKPNKYSLNETILKAIKQIHKKAINKNIEICFIENNKVVLCHDINWTTEAIFNVLDNAVKYTYEGGTVNIEIISYEMFSRIDIKDTGYGIKEEDIEKIFSRFYRGESSRDIEGVGIGLYLSREIISKQGGYIKVSSSKDGSIFSIFLPN